MTSNARSQQGEVQIGAGFCTEPQRPTRWLQGLALPVQCFSARLTVHQQAGAPVYCYDFEVADPHTKELLAKVVEPAKRYSEVLHLAQQVSLDLRSTILHLTDPDPF